MKSETVTHTRLNSIYIQKKTKPNYEILKISNITFSFGRGDK